MLSFNFTHLDIDHSRGFGIITSNTKIEQEAIKLFAFDDLAFPDNQAYFAAGVQFRFPQTLTSDKGLGTVFQDCASMQANFRELGHF